MGIASKYNTSAPRFSFKFDGKPTFCQLDDLYVEGQKTVFVLRGLYLSDKGKFGTAPVAITDKVFVNLPKFLTATVTEMVKDAEFVDAVNAGKVSFSIYPYESHGKTCYGVEWIDTESIQ